MALYPTAHTYQEKLFCFSSTFVLVILLPPNILQERDKVQLQIVNYIFYGNGTLIRACSKIGIQLVWTCLVLNWDQDKKCSFSYKARDSFVEIRTNGLNQDFLRIDLAKLPISYTIKRNDLSGSGLISESQSDRTRINPFSSIYSYSRARIQESLT